jgi:hypothetical protein
MIEVTLVGMEATFLNTLAFLSFQISHAVSRSKEVRLFHGRAINSRDMAPPFFEGVIVGPKVCIKIHKSGPFLELISHSEGVPIFEDNMGHRLRRSLAKLPRSIGPFVVDEAIRRPYTIL